MAIESVSSKFKLGRGKEIMTALYSMSSSKLFNLLCMVLVRSCTVYSKSPTAEQGLYWNRNRLTALSYENWTMLIFQSRSLGTALDGGSAGVLYELAPLNGGLSANCRKYALVRIQSKFNIHKSSKGTSLTAL